MSRFVKKISRQSGLAPGTLVHIGDERSAKVRITYFDYNESKCEEREIKNVEECFPLKHTSTVSWINIDGVHDLDIVEKIGRNFDIHPLVLEDVVNTGQRPKYEDFEEYLYIVLKMIYYNGKDKDIKIEQVSLLLGKNYVISFQEQEGDVFEKIRDRIRTGKGRIRKEGADFLAYAILDAIIDGYFSILEKMGEDIEIMEEKLIKEPNPRILRKIHSLKRDMIFLRRSIWPLREVISGVMRGESRLIKKTTSVYLRDVYDHTIQVIDTIESFRDMVSGMLDIYLSGLSNRMNEVMKVLTIFASIFIPLTFIAGVYGMNFKYMPELNWKYGYFAVLGFMALVGLTMAAYFKRKRWF